LCADAPRFFALLVVLRLVCAAVRCAGVRAAFASAADGASATERTSAATLDLLSAGRFELGLGSGAVWPAITAYDGPSRTPGEAVDALTEAIAVIRAIWSDRHGIRLPNSRSRRFATRRIGSTQAPNAPADRRRRSAASRSCPARSPARATTGRRAAVS